MISIIELISNWLRIIKPTLKYNKTLTENLITN